MEDLRYTDDVEQRHLTALVGPNSGYYLAKWQPLRRGEGSRAGFNWAAFFFAPLWMGFRKMYMAAGIYYAVVVGVLLLQNLLIGAGIGVAETASQFTSLIFALACGLYGNRWYLDHANSVVAQARRDFSDEDSLLTELARRGGTSVVSAIGVLVAFLAAVAVLGFFGSGMFG